MTSLTQFLLFFLFCFVLFFSFQHLKYQQLFLCNIYGKGFRCLKSCKIMSLERKILDRDEVFFMRTSTNALNLLSPLPVMPTECQKNIFTKKYLILQMKLLKKLGRFRNCEEIWNNLFTNDLTESRPLISFSITQLDQGLANIRFNSQENYEN